MALAGKMQRPPANSTRCFATAIGGLPIQLHQQGVDSFTVIYWQQIKTDLDYGEAAAELGACIMHALACDSRLDNREVGED